MRPNRPNGGFGLVELLVVSVLGSIVLASIYQVLVVNQRAFTANSAKIGSQQSVRAGAEVLFGELREISAVGGDILAFGDDSLKVRVGRRFGLVCARNIAAGRLTVRRAGGHFEQGDSVFVFAETDTATVADDRWIVGTVSAAGGDQACGGGDAQDITVPAVANAASGANDTVQVGAPVRSFVHYTYGLFDVSGEPYLARRDSDGTVVPLAGPLVGGTGLQFTYYDTLGAAPTIATGIALVEVTLRALTAARWTAGGALVGDSLTTRIFTRN